MRAAVLRHPLLMRAPAELGRLQAFRDEAFHRPGVDEHFSGFGCFARWVSRSAMWMPLTPSSMASLAHSSRLFGSVNLWPVSLATLTSACLTNHDTMPGLAPQQEMAVVPPGLARLVGEQPLAQGVIRARLRPELVVEIEAGPRLDDRVDVERADLAAQTHDVDRVGVDRDVDAEALAAAFGQQLAEQFL